MKNTTLCYLEKDNQYLMLHRVKKENDENKDKWIGIGGKFEYGETPFDCVRREIFEETGLICKHPEYRGIITFVSNEFGTEYMHLFTSKEFCGEIKTDCAEGELLWVPIDEIDRLSLWEGDKIFLKLLREEKRFFSLRLEYSKNTLVSYKIEY